MALPLSRDETAVAGGTVRASLLNNLQDWLIALWSFKLVVEDVHRTMISFAAAQSAAHTATWTASPSCWTAAGADTFLMPVNIDEERTIKAVRVAIKDSGTAVQFRLWRVNAFSGARTQLGSTQTSAASTTDQTLSVTGLTEVVTGTVNTYYAEVAVAVGHRLYSGQVDHVLT